MKDELNNSKHDSLFPHAYGTNTHVPEERKISHLSFVDLVVTYLAGAMIVLLSVGVGVRAAKHAEESIAVASSNSTKSAGSNGSLGGGSGKSDRANASKESGQAAKSNEMTGLLWLFLNKTFKNDVPEFDVVEAGRRIDRASRLTGVCIAQTDLHTMTRITITFENSGRATNVQIDDGPFVGTPQGACIARIMRGVSVPAFQGSPVIMRRSFRID